MCGSMGDFNWGLGEVVGFTRDEGATIEQRPPDRRWHPKHVRNYINCAVDLGEKWGRKQPSLRLTASKSKLATHQQRILAPLPADVRYKANSGPHARTHEHKSGCTARRWMEDWSKCHVLCSRSRHQTD